MQDDKWFVEHISYFSSIWHFLSIRYQQWSSRILIEYILVNILNFSPYVWAFLNSVIMTLIFFSVSAIAGIKNILSNTILAIAIFSYSILPDVGLCSVSINYIWPLACGLFFLSVIKDIFFNNKEIVLFKKIICLFLLFFSCNAELMCLFLLFFIFSIIVYYSLNNERISSFVYISLILIIIGLMIHLLCPGNYERIFEDAGDYGKQFSKFSKLGFFQVFVYGFVSSFLGIKYSCFINVFFVLLFLCGIKMKDKGIVIISSFPIITLLIKSFFVNFLPDVKFSLFITGFFTPSNIINFVPKDIIIALIILFFIFFSVEYTLYKYFDKKMFYFCSLILITAFFIRIIFSWTPSIFTAQDRTFIFTNYFVLCVDMIIIKSLFINYKTNNKYLKFITFKIKE